MKNEEQMDWLRMVRDHVANSFRIERDDLEMTQFDGQRKRMQHLTVCVSAQIGAGKPSPQ